ncbi:hypothetical protein [Aeromicrobium stalagmiti]|uniref:hypothetical protein n=1 Tax=Aeromicrobium stalagmiti TaxID=2738988 RepID=UPI0015699797|nr:hypothetical protein [Aeromicrobium stalagmiti]NRQ50835.1 hypothetical protein [Aeromicrobium stalagmiti]
MNPHDGDDITPAGEAPFDREGTWHAWVSYLTQFGTVRADPSSGVFVDDGRGTTAHVMLSADEIYDFALGSRILSEGLPLQLTDDFFESFGSQHHDHVDYVRDGWDLAERH